MLVHCFFKMHNDRKTQLPQTPHRLSEPPENVEKTKCRSCSYHNHNINRANTSFENVAKSKYSGITVKIFKNYIQENRKRKFKSRNAYYN
jgi:hypothetical protein